MAIPVALCAFTHLWNPVGFPDLHGDEGHYMVKAMSTLEGTGLQPQDRYAAPYFGQLFLAGIFKIIGYPDSMNPVQGDVHSIERIWLVPRMIMGLLAVVDTFLIYKIAETRYNRNVAFIASILFAVMPLSWVVRRLFLESIQTPFLLMSVLLAVYICCPLVNKGSKNRSSIDSNYNKGNKKNTSLVLLSGIFLGLSIFTKIPVFTMMPLVGFLIYTNSNRNLKNLGLWFIPVILIPLIWPAHAMLTGELDMWFEGILWQTTGRGDQPLDDALISFYKTDPVLLTLAVAGLLFTAIVKKDYFPILGIIPFLILLYLLGYVSTFHFIPLMPLFCIAAAVLIVDVPNKISNNKKISIQKMLPVIVVLGIGAFGLITTSLSLSKNLTAAELATSAFISQQLPASQGGICQYVICRSDVTLIGNPIYLWLPKYIFDKNYEQGTFYMSKQIETEKFVLIEDKGFDRQMSGDDRKAQVLKEIYGKSTLMASFYDDKEKSKGRIDIRSN